MKHVYLLFLFVMLLTGCKSYNAALGPSANSENFQSMSYCVPVIDYGYISRRDNIEPSDSVTYIAQIAFDMMLDRTQPDKAFGCVDYSECDSLIIPNLYSNAVNRDVNKGVFFGPGWIKEKPDTRYALILFSHGFTRRSGNYVGQVAKNIGIGIVVGALLGSAVIESPIKYITALTCAVVDVETNEVIYSKTVQEEEDPAELESHLKCYKSLYKNFLSDLKDLRKIEARRNK